MFSTDKNIDTIVGLVEELKKYGGLRLEMIKLDATEKIVKVITALILTLALSLLLCAIVTYLSFSAAYALGDLFDCMSLGFLCIAGVYVLLFFIVYARRKAWIERPLVHLLAEILLEK